MTLDFSVRMRHLESGIVDEVARTDTLMFAAAVARQAHKVYGSGYRVFILNQRGDETPWD